MELCQATQLLSEAVFDHVKGPRIHLWSHTSKCGHSSCELPLGENWQTRDARPRALLAGNREHVCYRNIAIYVVAFVSQYIIFNISRKGK